MNLEEAKALCQANPRTKIVYAGYFGKGWSMGWDGKFFVDINPHTGSLLGHGPFTERDECEWFEGQQPDDPDIDETIERVIAENKDSDVLVSPNWDRTRKIIAESLLADHLHDRVVPTANFFDDLGADSLDLVEITMALEEEFDIEITDQEAEPVKTVADAARLVDEKVRLK